MIQRNRADQDVRGGEVFVENIEKTEVSDFGFCAQGDSAVWQGRKRLRKRECSSQGQRMAVWLILNEIRKAKMEIPVYTVPMLSTLREIVRGSMLREIVWASLAHVMVAFPMCASLLTFQIDGALDKQSIPQAYGDRIDGTFTTGVFHYGSAGGATPNVVLSYGPATRGISSQVDCGIPYPPANNTGCVYWWGGGFGNLNQGVAQMGRGNYYGEILVTLTADPGYLVSLSSLDLAGHYTASAYSINGVTVTDGSDVVLNSLLGISVPGSAGTRASLSFTNIHASTLKIWIDASNIATPDGENVGLSNLQFSQVAVPEPSTWFLLASGLGLVPLGARRSRRNS